MTRREHVAELADKVTEIHRAEPGSYATTNALLMVIAAALVNLAEPDRLDEPDCPFDKPRASRFEPWAAGSAGPQEKG